MQYTEHGASNEVWSANVNDVNNNNYHHSVSNSNNDENVNDENELIGGDSLFYLIKTM